MKIAIALLGLFSVSMAAECPEQQQVLCVDDINKAFPVCKKAAEHITDIDADLQCLKYFTTMEHDCWDCICVIAKQEGWKIKGCDQALTYE